MMEVNYEVNQFLMAEMIYCEVSRFLMVEVNYAVSF